jgi:hypothetical protein
LEKSKNHEFSLAFQDSSTRTPQFLFRKFKPGLGHSTTGYECALCVEAFYSDQVDVTKGNGTCFYSPLSALISRVTFSSAMNHNEEKEKWN